MAEIQKQPREMEKRDTTERAKKWAPPSLLPDPDPEPGYVFRWVRLAALGVADPTNISSKLREGWEPVRASSQPKMQMFADPKSRFPDGIEVGGLLLCKIPMEFMEQRSAYYKGQADAQMQSVDGSFMRENDPRMPLFNERRTQVTFGKGS